MYKYTDNQTSGVLASREAAHATSVIKINAMSNYLQIEGDYRENPDINIGDNAIIKSNTHFNVGIYKTPTNANHKFDVNGTLNADKIYENSFQSSAVIGTFQLIPAGSIIAFGGSSGAAPSGWLLCDGADYSRTVYNILFDAISTTYGSANGTTFKVPNLKGRVIVQRDASNTKFDTMGETGGADTHTLTVDEMPQHNHGVTDNGHSHGYTAPNGSIEAAESLTTNPAVNNTISTNTGSSVTGITINNTGGDAAHNNLQPYLVMSYIIKY